VFSLSPISFGFREGKGRTGLGGKEKREREGGGDQVERPKVELRERSNKEGGERSNREIRPSLGLLLLLVRQAFFYREIGGEHPGDRRRWLTYQEEGRKRTRAG